MFISVFLKILPLYLMILLGFIAGKVLKTDRDTISKFLLFIVTPVVIFSGVVKMESNDHMILLLPILVYLMSCIICVVMYKLSAVLFSSNMRNIIAFSSGSSNTGHFGLPVALLILDSETVAIYMISFLGITLFENTYGFYVAAKGYFTALDCIKKLLKLPALYAILCGLILKATNVEIPTMIYDLFDNMRSTYIVLGMSIVGIGISSIKDFRIEWRVIFSTLFTKYILWPIFMFSLVMVDYLYLNLYNHEVYIALMILAIVPMSISTVVVGSVLKYPAEQLIWVVLISVMVGLFYVPAMLSVVVRLLI